MTGRAGVLVVGLACALLTAVAPAAAPPPDPKADRGEAIYRRGVLGSGAPLIADSATGTRLEGAAAACVNCHRRSGLGAKEGRSTVPPIAGRYLFRTAGGRGDAAELPYVEGIRADRSPYTDASAARAIRAGIDSDDRALGPLMPHFRLDDDDMAALLGYLKRLDRGRTAGISDTELHVATIVAPDADPVARRGMLDVLNQFVADANATRRASTATLRPSGKTMYSKMMFRAHRHWQLHVWQLEGAPATWQAQLDKRLAEEPVFAVLSGIGGAEWGPVHAFCQRAALPCLFPNVERPPASADGDFYALYFSRGVLLEADLFAAAIGAPGADTAPRPVLQVCRAGDVGEAAAKALAAALGERGIAVTTRRLGRDDGDAAVDEAVRDAAGTLVLWLRPADLARLARSPAPAGAVFVSGLMGGLERAPLPAAWREAARLSLPVDLPDRRQVRVAYALGWFSLRRIALVAPRVQVDTYLAGSLLSETLNHMADAVARDYLVERLEDTIEHRVITGYYPKLSLAPGQRFASKGGFLVRFADAAGTGVRAEGEWTVP